MDKQQAAEKKGNNKTELEEQKTRAPKKNYFM
jgi:hypothetical protein